MALPNPVYVFSFMDYLSVTTGQILTKLSGNFETWVRFYTNRFIDDIIVGHILPFAMIGGLPCAVLSINILPGI